MAKTLTLEQVAKSIGTSRDVTLELVRKVKPDTLPGNGPHDFRLPPREVPRLKAAFQKRLEQERKHLQADMQADIEANIRAESALEAPASETTESVESVSEKPGTGPVRIDGRQHKVFLDEDAGLDILARYSDDPGLDLVALAEEKGVSTDTVRGIILGKSLKWRQLHDKVGFAPPAHLPFPRKKRDPEPVKAAEVTPVVSAAPARDEHPPAYAPPKDGRNTSPASPAPRTLAAQAPAPRYAPVQAPQALPAPDGAQKERPIVNSYQTQAPSSVPAPSGGSGSMAQAITESRPDLVDPTSKQILTADDFHGPTEVVTPDMVGDRYYCEMCDEWHYDRYMVRVRVSVNNAPQLARIAVCRKCEPLYLSSLVDILNGLTSFMVQQNELDTAHVGIDKNKWPRTRQLKRARQFIAMARPPKEAP